MLLTIATYLLPHIALLAQNRIKEAVIIIIMILRQINFACCKLFLTSTGSQDEQVCV